MVKRSACCWAVQPLNSFEIAEKKKMQAGFLFEEVNNALYQRSESTHQWQFICEFLEKIPVSFWESLFQS